MEDKIAELTKRIEELERQQSEHVKQQDIFPGTIKERHLEDGLLSDYATLTGTETLTGKTMSGASNTFTALPAANLLIASQAVGDILYASSTSAWVRLAIGAAGTYLKGGTTPSYGFAFSSYKLLSGTRDMTAATGNVTYTGYGFTPKLLITFGSFTGGTIDSFSFGITDGTTTKCMSQDEVGNFTFSNDLIVAWDTYATKNQSAVLSSFNSDGYVLTWTITASAPSAGTFNFASLALG